MLVDWFAASSSQASTLLNNAGVILVLRLELRVLRKRAMNTQFCVNRVSHALLTKLLLPLLQRTAGEPISDVCVIDLSPASHSWVPKSGLS